MWVHCSLIRYSTFACRQGSSHFRREEACPARRSMTPSPPDVGSGTIVSAVVGLGSGDRSPPHCPSPPSSTTFHAAPCRRCLSGELHCAAKISFPKYSSWSSRLRRRAQDGRRTWGCGGRGFNRCSGRARSSRECNARRSCGELHLQKRSAGAAAEACAADNGLSPGLEASSQHRAWHQDRHRVWHQGIEAEDILR